MKNIKVAVASSDGRVINRHFGKADRFLIFEYQDGNFVYIQTRTVTPCCNMGEHQDNAFENAAKVLSDCSVIIVSKIGISAADYLESRGFAVYEAPFRIDAVLKKLAEKEV